MGPRPAIVNVGYRSTNFYVVASGQTRLLIDLGWPGTLAQLTAGLKQKGLALSDITHGLATHYHPDHAGLAEELKRAGMRLWIVDLQVAAVPLLRGLVKPTDGYTDIKIHDSRVVAASESRAALKTIGLAGEIIATPGHSDDSVTLVLDTGEAFTGDLGPVEMATDEARDVVAVSWAAIRRLGATTLYPGHGPVRPFPQR